MTAMLNDYVTSLYSELIEEMVNMFELPSGDISPELVARLEASKKELVDILYEFYLNNS